MIDYEKCLTEIAPCQNFDIEDYLENVSSLESMKVVLGALAKDIRISLQDETDNDSKHWHDDVQHLIDLNLHLKNSIAEFVKHLSWCAFNEGDFDCFFFTHDQLRTIKQWVYDAQNLYDEVVKLGVEWLKDSKSSWGNKMAK